MDTFDSFENLQSSHVSGCNAVNFGHIQTKIESILHF